MKLFEMNNIGVHRFEPLANNHNREIITVMQFREVNSKLIIYWQKSQVDLAWPKSPNLKRDLERELDLVWLDISRI